MTILFADGFEDSSEADYPSTNTSIGAAGTGRRGGKSLAIGSSASANEIFPVPGSPTTLFAHVAVNPQTSTGAFLGFNEAGGNHVMLYRASDGMISAYRASTSNLLGSSAAGVMPVSAYTSVQVKVVIHDTTGSVEVRLNGSATPIINVTNVDTRNSGTGVVTAVMLGGMSGFGIGTSNHDDLVVWDTTGSENNTWLGDLRVDSIMPTADGDTTTMTTSSGSDHYALVDEVPASGTDYVQSGTPGNKDLYQLADLSHTPASIYAVLVAGSLLKDDAGTREVAFVLKSSSTESDSANMAPSTASLRYTKVWNTDPNGNITWTKSAVDALQAGVKVTI